MKKNSKCEGDVKQLVYLVLAVFLVSLTVLSVIFIINQIKESKYIGRDNIQRSTINVTGTGEINAIPDLGTISFSVITIADTADEASEENTEKMNNIIGIVKEFGVKEKDIKTTNYSLYPQYDYNDEDDYYWQPIDKEREIVSYRASQTLTVKIRDIDDSGEIIKAATKAGADQIGGLNFTIDDEDELKIEARELAIKDAKEKAEILANQLGVKLIKIMYFSENSYPYYDDYRYGKGEMSMDMGGGATPSIEPGENTVRSTVSITYEIN